MPRDFADGDFIKMSRADLLKQTQELKGTMIKAMSIPYDATGQKCLAKTVTQADLDQLAAAKAANNVPAELAKMDGLKAGDVIPESWELRKASLTTAGGLVTYDLRDPSLHLVPWLSPLRDMLPRVDKSAKAGTTAHWKSIFATSIVQTSYQADPWINEGARAPLFTFSASDESAAYVSQGIDGSVTYEAVSAAVGLEDANATARFFALESLMTREEDAILGGNVSLKLGTVGTVTVGEVAFGGLGTLPTTTYYVACVALTYAGYRNSAVTLAGVATQKAITTPDGKVMGVNGGSSNTSAISSGQAITLGQALTASVAAINGAVAYAWYVGTVSAAASLHLQQITTVPSLSQSVPLVTNTQLNSAITQDLSVNDGTTGSLTGAVTAYDGFIVQTLNAAGAFTAATGVYAKTNAYAINLLGGTLTSSGAGSIVEIDDMLQYMWNTFRVSVTMILVNAQELKNITKKVLNSASAPLVRYETSADGEHYDLTASGTVSNYFNPYLPGGGRRIPIMVHPTLPPGTIFAYSETLPAYFKTNSTPTVAEMLCRRDYYSRDWADVTREYQFGVYCETVLAVYAPFCLGLITGIGNG